MPGSEPPLPLEVELFLQTVRAAPWGVLGRQLTEGREAERAPVPDFGLAYVDPVELLVMQVDGPFGATGVSAEIYRHLGIEDDREFPDAVSAQIQDEADATLHRYKGRDGIDQQVIHAAPPDLREPPYSCASEATAIEALSNAYYSIFREFVGSELTRLRLVPLSAGDLSGRFAESMAELTALSIRGGFCQLNERDRRRMLDAASIELCIYEEEHLEGYRQALKRLQGTVRGAGYKTPSGVFGRDLVAELELAAAEAEARGLEHLPEEQRLLLMQPVIGDRPGTGHSQLRVGELQSPRRPAPDVAKASSMQALKQEVQKKRPSTGSPRRSQEAKPSPKANGDREEGHHDSEPVETDASRTIHFDSHFKAKTVGLTPDHLAASWRKHKYGGFVLSLEALRKNVVGRWFEVRIEEADASRWTDGIGIGIVLKPSKDALSSHMDAFGNFEGFTCELLPEHWMLGYDGIRARIRGHIRYLTVAEMPLGRWKPSELRHGDVVGLLVTPDGHMLLFVNEELTIFAQHCAGLEATWKRQVHAALDLDGCIKTVRFLETNAAVPGKVLAAHGKFRDGEFLLRQLDEQQDVTAVQDL